MNSSRYFICCFFRAFLLPFTITKERKPKKPTAAAAADVVCCWLIHCLLSPTSLLTCLAVCTKIWSYVRWSRFQFLAWRTPFILIGKRKTSFASQMVLEQYIQGDMLLVLNIFLFFSWTFVHIIRLQALAQYIGQRMETYNNKMKNSTLVIIFDAYEWRNWGGGEKEREKFRFIWDYDHGVLDVNCMTKRMFAVETFTREQIERCSNHVKNCNNLLMIITFTSSCVCVCARQWEPELSSFICKMKREQSRLSSKEEMCEEKAHTHTHKLNENEPNNNGTEKKIWQQRNERTCAHPLRTK